MKLYNRILISGAYGGLGSDFCDYLTGKGFVINKSRVDITNKEEVFSEMKGIDPEIVIHLAAMVGTKDCEEVPQQAIRTNVEGTFNAVDAARKLNIKFVYFSTTAIFKPGIEPIDELSPIEPYTIYGKTKLWGEQIAKSYIPRNDLLVVRPCFGFGGRTDVSQLGALIRSHYSHKYVNLLLDMNNEKDYTHVRNISHALYLMLSKDRFGEEYNVSYGEAIPYGEIIKKLIKHGISPYYYTFPELDYMGNHIVSNKKIVNDLGFKNLISLDKGIEMVLEKIKTNEKTK